MDDSKRRAIDAALFAIPIQYRKFQEEPAINVEVRRFCGLLSVLIENGVELPPEGRQYLASSLRAISKGLDCGKAFLLAGKAKDFSERDQDIADYIHDRIVSGHKLEDIFSDIAEHGVPNVQKSDLKERQLRSIWSHYKEGYKLIRQ